MSDHTPKISVIMPAYNSGKYIEEAIRSVINQTMNDWELIVIDDGSTDNTVEIVERIAQHDSRIYLLKNKKNIGVAATRNRGFDEAKGEYIALLDSDDIWHESKLSTQLALMLKTNSDIVYCSYRIVDENGNKKCSDFIVHERTDFNSTLVESVMSCSTVLLARRIVDNYKFITDYKHEDLVLWLQLLKDGYKAYGTKEILADYRVIKGSRSFNKVKSAINRFKVYFYFNIPIWKSLICLLKFVCLGIKKYHRI